MSSGSVTAEPPVQAAPPSGGTGRWRQYAVALGFLAPALILLGVWIVYPAVKTIVRSFYDRDGTAFVGIDNYRAIFSTPTITTAIKNNAIWVLVVPALVTAIGLIFAVLTEQVSWRLAFRTVVFMPMAISLFAAGVIWRIMDQQDPSRGAINAGLQVVHDEFKPPGPLQGAIPSTGTLAGSDKRGYVLKTPLHPGGVALLGMTGIAPENIPKGAEQAAAPSVSRSQIGGVVWRDFKPGGGTPGKVEQGELGLPGVTLDLKDASGKQVASTKSGHDGAFTFDGVGPGLYKVDVGSASFRAPFGGVAWAGFAMVIIAAGLAAIPRDTLEAARTDGATELQVFRRVTVPLLAPVLTVVFITMLINVLKVFDIVLSVAPGSSQASANVIALAMWRTAFGGVNDFGVGSAIAVFLFILVLPVLLLNIRRFKREA